MEGKAKVSLNAGNTAQAILACTTLLEENPRSAIAMTLLSACFAQQGEIASAIEHLEAALAMAPDHADLIARKIYFLDFLSDADFAVQQAARKNIGGTRSAPDCRKGSSHPGTSIRTEGS
ncbi:tetratricopeptide (TPR) repeat protein [Bradyrhizobium sp. LM3.6]